MLAWKDTGGWQRNPNLKSKLRGVCKQCGNKARSNHATLCVSCWGELSD